MLYNLNHYMNFVKIENKMTCIHSINKAHKNYAKMKDKNTKEIS